MQYDNLPKELRKNGAFCLWNYEDRKEKAKAHKVPYQISGKRGGYSGFHRKDNRTQGRKGRWCKNPADSNHL